MSRSHNIGSYIKNVNAHSIHDKSRASLASLDTKIQTAAAGAPNPDVAQIALMHGDTGAALIPLKVDGSGHLEVNFTDEGGLNLEATQQLVLADTTTIAASTSSLDVKLPAQGQAVMANSVPVAIASDQSAIPVTLSGGGGALNLEATQQLVLADTTAIAGSTATIATAVSGSEMQIDIVDRGGVATEAKQPALGTAGAASTDVITMQGIAGMTALVVDGSAVTQPVSAASLPLPTNAATEATLASIDGKITACDTGAVVVSSSALPTGAATAAKQPALGAAGAASTDVISIQGIAGMTAVVVDGSAVTQPVSAASLPLPTNAATETTLATIETNTDSLAVVGGGLEATALRVTLASDCTGLLSVDAASSGQQIASEATLLTLDGKITACDTGAVVVSSSALPTGAATAAKQPALGTAGAASTDVITMQGIAGMTAVVVDGSGVTQPVSAASLPLPTNAATEATLATIETNTDSLAVVGGGLEATALRVTLASDCTGLLSVDAASSGQQIASEATLLTIDGKITACDTGAVVVSALPVGGSQANMWNAATPGAGGKSTALDCQYASYVDIFGDVDGACALSVELSQDNSNWYTSQYLYVAGGAGDFHIAVNTAARYVRLDMDAAGVTVTATGCFKA